MTACARAGCAVRGERKVIDKALKGLSLHR
jgi:hypothetical protein